MKKRILSILSAVLFLGNLNAQTAGHKFDPTNAREGETVEYCHQHKLMNELLKDPKMMQIYLEEQAKDEAYLNGTKKQDAPKGMIYKIPIVFHILHNGGPENISDAQIHDALFILNRDYRRQNADANTVVSDFQGMPTDAEIEFVLATKAPDGTCFKGITRTQHPLSNDGSSGTAQVNAIVAGNDVFNGQWPGNRYLNVYVCGEIGGAAGYTYKPAFGGTGMTNGIWILHNYTGSIGTSSNGTSRTLTHECGHWLNLDHTWGGSNNPGLANNCNSDDNVTDTPNCMGLTSCNLNANTCNSVNAYWDYNVRDNTENYMDYSYCSKMYTPGQAQRQRNALNSSSGGRNNLWTANNLSVTGADGNLYLCKAQFYVNRTTACAGESIQFFDDSYNLVSGWSWTFEGGSPATSTEQNPTISYAAPGIYTVTLTATDGTTNDTETKTAYIKVLPAAATIPFLEGFEGYSTLSNINQWEIVNMNNNNAFELESNFGHTGNKCAKLINFGQTTGSVDELIASAVNLSGVTSVTMSFRYAYRKRNTADLEYLKVFLTKDCGETWVQRKTLGGNALSTLTSSTSWAPASSEDWVTVHMTNVTSDYWVDNFRYKFRFESAGGNNLYLDNINIYPGSPSEDIVLGLNESGDINGLSLYPNPADDEVNVRFNVNASETAYVQVMDITGKVVQTNVVNALEGTNLVVIGTEALAAGSYFLNLQVGGAQKNLQFVIK
jgi:PKD repeat protein